MDVLIKRRKSRADPNENNVANSALVRIKLLEFRADSPPTCMRNNLAFIGTISAHVVQWSSA